MIDWEAASDQYEPWFDLTTAPAAPDVLAHRQTGGPFQEVAERVLAPTHWTGAEMRTAIEARWDFPLPAAWGITLSTMRLALRHATKGSAMPNQYADLVRLASADTAVRDHLVSIGSTVQGRSS